MVRGSRVNPGRLVALRILHGDPELPSFFELVELRRSQIDQTDRLLRKAPASCLVIEAGRGPHVQVDAVLGALPLRDPLEEDPRSAPIRIADPAGIVPVLLGDPLLAGPVLPRSEPLRRRIGRVAQHLGPERGERSRVRGIERHLDLGGHQPQLLSNVFRNPTAQRS